MTQQQQEARDNIDYAICDWLRTLGVDPTNLDFSWLDQELEDAAFYAGYEARPLQCRSNPALRRA